MADNPSRHHVGAVADARGHVPDRGGRDAEFPEVVEPGDAGVVAPDPGIVEDRRGNAELRGDIGGIDAAMRAVDDDCTLGFAADAGDAVGGHDRRGLGGHGMGLAQKAARPHHAGTGEVRASGRSGRLRSQACQETPEQDGLERCTAPPGTAGIGPPENSARYGQAISPGIGGTAALSGNTAVASAGSSTRRWSLSRPFSTARRSVVGFRSRLW